MAAAHVRGIQEFLQRGDYSVAGWPFCLEMPFCLMALPLPLPLPLTLRPRGMFDKHFGLFSHIHLGKALQEAFGKICKSVEGDSVLL